MKYLTIMIVSIFLLSACSLSSIAESRYPDRSKFSFKDDATDSTYIYLCEKLATPEQTKQRARIAHQHISKQINTITNELMADILEKENFSIFSAMGSSMDMNKKTEALAKDTEKKYKCLFIDAID